MDIETNIDWYSERPTVRQVTRLRNNGFIDHEIRMMSKGEASDAINMKTIYCKVKENTQ